MRGAPAWSSNKPAMDSKTTHLPLTAALACLAACLAPLRLPAANPAAVWLTDFPAAQARAAAEKKPILLFFHGSDWCPPCALLQKQVFDTPEFARYAADSLVLLDVDFPERGKQPDDLKRANQALKARFNLSPEPGEGFPTVALVDPAGRTLFQETGYAGGGPAAVLPHLQRHTAAVAPPGPAGFRDLTVDEFARMAADPANVVLDVRTAQEFAAGHVKGAVNLDVKAAGFAEQAAKLDRNRVYLVHCAAGVRSLTACQQLGPLGFTRVYNLPGGFRAWVKDGRPVEK